MANTVSLLNYANTFGDWILTTNALGQENNTLATGNYHKTTGTLWLDNNTGLALQANGNAIFGQQLQVIGIGSSLFVQNNSTIGGQLNLTNTVIALTSSGQIAANGSGNGLIVSNNTILNGTTTAVGNVSLSNNLVVTKNITTNNLNVLNNVNITNSANVINGINTNNLQASVSVTSPKLYCSTIQTNSTLAIKNNTSEIVHIDSLGNVGIGTNNPDNYPGYTTLTVGGVNDGNIDILYRNANLGISTSVYKGSSSVTDQSLVTGYRSDSSTNSVWELGLYNNEIILGADQSIPLWFYTNNTERMRITADGDVIIGASSIIINDPAYTILGVAGSGKDGAIQVAYSNSTLGLNLYTAKGATVDYDENVIWGYDSAGNSIWEIGKDASGQIFFWGYSNDPFIIATNNIERMHIDTTGNVGIGTTTPTSLANYTTLTIGGDVNNGVLDLHYNNGFTGLSIAVDTPYGGGNVTGYNTSGVSVWELGYNTLYDNSLYLGTDTTTPMYFYTNNIERMRITKEGRVGIGTIPVPTALLDVNGSIKGAVTQGTVLATTSGTSKQFTGIPPWVKKITISFAGVQTVSSALLLLQIGTGGTATTSGYGQSGASIGVSLYSNIASNGFAIGGIDYTGPSSGNIMLVNNYGNIWSISGNIFNIGSTYVSFPAGIVSLAGALDNI